MIIANLNVYVVSDYLLFTLPAIEEAVVNNKGKIVGVESEINPISINWNIKRLQANLLILEISGKSSCKLIQIVKKNHPQIAIIAITKKLGQITKLIKTKMVRAILAINDETKLLIKAVKEVTMGNRYYSPRVSQEMAREIAADLTPREKEIWNLRSEDKTRSQIAKTLQISYSTVCTHVQNIENKRDIKALI